MENEKPIDIEMDDVESSNILKIGWKAETLRVQFKGGAYYDYYRVPKIVYVAMTKAKSKGEFLGLNIKGEYDYKKVEVPQ